MLRQKKTWIIGALGVALGALALLAAGITGLTLQPGRALPLGRLLRPFGLPTGLSTAPSEPLGLWAVVLFWGMLLFTAIALVVSPQLRKRVLRMLPVYIGFTLLLYALIRALRYINDTFRSQDQVGGAQGDPPLGDAAAELPIFASTPSPWLVGALSVALAALLVGALFLLLRRARWQAQPNPLEELAQEAQEALDELRGGGNFRDAVMRCYAEMSEVLRRERNLQRQQAMTPREFERHLASLGVQDTHIRRLTRLFELVRYGAGVPGEREEREALACLTAIVQSYGRAS